MRIALVDDDVHLAQVMKLWLTAQGYDVIHFTSGLEFTAALRKDSFDLYILDWVMPDMDGEEILKWLIEQNDHTTPVIFVTLRDSEEDIARILNLGADDYITKPIREKVLLARIAAVTRRSQSSAAREVFDYPPFRFNTASHLIYKDNEPVKFTQKEYELAFFLFKNVGRLLSRGHILSAVWGQGTDFTTRTVDTHISRVRRKLDLSAGSGWRLNAIYHQGYRLELVEHDDGATGT